jgi:hypothetical protein
MTQSYTRFRDDDVFLQEHCAKLYGGSSAHQDMMTGLIPTWMLWDDGIATGVLAAVMS